MQSTAGVWFVRYILTTLLGTCYWFPIEKTDIYMPLLQFTEKRESLLHEIIEILWSLKTILIKKNYGFLEDYLISDLEQETYMET